MEPKEEKVIDYSSLSYAELSEMSNNDHRQDSKEYDNQQNALALTMIGLIALICGVLFLILSTKKVMNKTQGIDYTSLQFFVCIACFVAAIVLLTLGLVRFFKAHKRRLQLKKEIAEISVLRKKLAISENNKEETL